MANGKSEKTIDAEVLDMALSDVVAQEYSAGE